MAGSQARVIIGEVLLASIATKQPECGGMATVADDLALQVYALLDPEEDGERA